MREIINDDYTPFGEEWENNMMKHNKKVLVRKLKFFYILRHLKKNALDVEKEYRMRMARDGEVFINSKGQFVDPSTIKIMDNPK